MYKLQTNSYKDRYVRSAATYTYSKQLYQNMMQYYYFLFAFIAFKVIVLLCQYYHFSTSQVQTHVLRTPDWQCQWLTLCRGES